ncbi:proton-conducting transporter membrane subunit, partial [Burkholderia pseudomallei]
TAAAIEWAQRVLEIGLRPHADSVVEKLENLASLSLIVGNLTGIVQRNIKRMLAYSAISNMGFVLLGLLAGFVYGYPSAAASAYCSAMF